MIPTRTHLTIVSLVILPLLLLAPRHLWAHCEVPCGIYGDQQRFEAMLEDQRTIAKAIDEIAKHLADLGDAPSPTAVNQIARWVSTKETHATRIQNTIAQYFMTQRIKPAEGTAKTAYVKKLTAAHAVMQAAMKSKQDPSPTSAVSLRTAILDFYRAYEGKEPQFD